MEAFKGLQVSKAMVVVDKHLKGVRFHRNLAILSLPLRLVVALEKIWGGHWALETL